jgi:MFS superfamily sulfate permease-like transporter
MDRALPLVSLDDRWVPQSVLCLRDYNLNKFVHDLAAGVTVGLVALPLAMAFAIASGLTPQAGIYCAVVTGFLISALGGSKTQIGGPTGAFVVVVAGIVAAHGVDGLFMCTVLAGILLVILGATGMGTAVKFIPRPVVVGFTNGIAVLIASTQLKDFFGLHIDKVPGVFWLRMEAIAKNFHTLSYEGTILAVGTVVAMLLCRAASSRIPGPWREIPQLLKLTKTDISVWLVTFALTVFADLTVAVEAGMILAALLFIGRVASTTTVSQVTDDYVRDGQVHILQDKDIPYYATIFRIHGPFLFGATDKISVVTEKMHQLPPVVILRLRNMTAIDATGLFALEEMARQLHATKRTLILCGAREQPARLIRQAEFEEVIGRENICDNVQAALRRAEDVFEKLESKAVLGTK